MTVQHAPAAGASQRPRALVAIKAIHSIALTAWAGIVLVEVLVLTRNAWACPLTAVAVRYTEDRRPNFDIFLPEWVARYNKEIFGTLYVLGVAFALLSWWQAR